MQTIKDNVCLIFYWIPGDFQLNDDLVQTSSDPIPGIDARISSEYLSVQDSLRRLLIRQSLAVHSLWCLLVLQEDMQPERSKGQALGHKVAVLRGGGGGTGREQGQALSNRSTQSKASTVAALAAEPAVLEDYIFAQLKAIKVERTILWETDSWRAQAKPGAHQEPGERSSVHTGH